MQKFKMEINGCPVQFTSEDVIKVTYQDNISGEITVTGKMIERELFGVFSIFGKREDEEGEVYRDYYFMENEVKSFVVLDDEKEEGFETKKVVVLGLKDIEGNYYVCPSYSNNGKEKPSRIEPGRFTAVNKVEVFPYATFTTLSVYDYFLYDFCHLEVELEMSSTEYEELNPAGICFYQFEGRKLKFIQEVETPWAYAETILNRVKGSNELKYNGIKYGLTTWQSMLEFFNEDEFSIFLNLWEKDRISLSKYNLQHLPRFLDYPIKTIGINQYAPCIFKPDSSEIEELYQKLDKKKLIRFISATRYSYLEKLPKEVLDKEFFEGLADIDELHIRERDYIFFQEFMPEETIEEYGADDLLEKCSHQLFYLKDNNCKDTEEHYNCCFMDYEDSFDDDSKASCSADLEALSIARILERVTPASVPILKALRFDKIQKYLSVEVTGLLSDNQMVS